MNRAGRLSELLAAVGSVIGHSLSPVLVTLACQVVWKLAALDGESTPAVVAVGTVEYLRISPREENIVVLSILSIS